jgi:hypothetical protein
VCRVSRGGVAMLSCIPGVCWRKYHQSCCQFCMATTTEGPLGAHARCSNLLCMTTLLT